MGLLEPINTRITDPQYFLDTPQQGKTLGLCFLLSSIPLLPGLMALSRASLPAAAILQKVGRPNLQLQMVRKGCFSTTMFSSLGRTVKTPGILSVLQSGQDGEDTRDSEKEP